MEYLITSIKKLEEFITPSLEKDDIFNFFIFPKFEKQFRSCMRFYRIETFGDDYEKSPIPFEEFNPKYDKFYGLNYNLLEQIIDFNELKNELKNCFIDYEDSYIREIKEQIQNPSEAQFKIFLYGTLKNLKDSHEILSNAQIENNKILNLIKNELLDSYRILFERVKNEVPVYEDIYSKFKALNTDIDVAGESNNGDNLVYTPSREEILKKLIDGSENRIKFESFERKLVDRSYLSIDFDQWSKSSISLVRFYAFCENNKLFKTQHLINRKGIKLLRQLYNFFEGDSIDTPSKRKKITSSEISKEYYFLK